jgi:hypothetical protein
MLFSSRCCSRRTHASPLTWPPQLPLSHCFIFTFHQSLELVFLPSIVCARRYIAHIDSCPLISTDACRSDVRITCRSMMNRRAVIAPNLSPLLSLPVSAYFPHFSHHCPHLVRRNRARDPARRVHARCAGGSSVRNRENGERKGATRLWGDD